MELARWCPVLRCSDRLLPRQSNNYVTHGLGKEVEKVPKIKVRVGSIGKLPTFSIKKSDDSLCVSRVHVQHKDGH